MATSGSAQSVAAGPRSKYTRSGLICADCGCRPCACDHAPAEAPAPLAAPEILQHRGTVPEAGRAIDYRIWDELIELHGLTVYESGILLWLYRHTHGHGWHNGRPVSLAEISRAVRCGRRTTMRALNRLQAGGLVARTRQHGYNQRSFAATVIAVTLEPAGNPQNPALAE